MDHHSNMVIGILVVGGLLHLVQQGGAWVGSSPAQSLAAPNVTAHLSTASVPRTSYLMWHYNYLCFLKG